MFNTELLAALNVGYILGSIAQIYFLNVNAIGLFVWLLLLNVFLGFFWLRSNDE